MEAVEGGGADRGAERKSKKTVGEWKSVRRLEK